MAGRSLVTGAFKASENDSWSGYTYVKSPNGRFEVRHPKLPTAKYSVWQWSTLDGWVWYCEQTNLQAALNCIGVPIRECFGQTMFPAEVGAT